MVSLVTSEVVSSLLMLCGHTSDRAVGNCQGLENVGEQKIVW